MSMPPIKKNESIVLEQYPNGGWIVTQPERNVCGQMAARIGAFSDTKAMLDALSVGLLGPAMPVAMPAQSLDAPVGSGTEVITERQNIARSLRRFVDEMRADANSRSSAGASIVSYHADALASLLGILGLTE